MLCSALNGRWSSSNKVDTGLSFGTMTFNGSLVCASCNPSIGRQQPLMKEDFRSYGCVVVKLGAEVPETSVSENRFAAGLGCTDHSDSKPVAHKPSDGNYKNQPWLQIMVWLCLYDLTHRHNIAPPSNFLPLLGTAMHYPLTIMDVAI